MKAYDKAHKDLTQEETQEVGGAGKNGAEREEGSGSLGRVGTWLIWITEVEGVDEVGGVTKLVSQEP